MVHDPNEQDHDKPIQISQFIHFQHRENTNGTEILILLLYYLADEQFNWVYCY